jgi:hypothetical protein
VMFGALGFALIDFVVEISGSEDHFWAFLASGFSLILILIFIKKLIFNLPKVAEARVPPPRGRFPNFAHSLSLECPSSVF